MPAADPVVIVGGGIGGLVSALALGRAGVPVLALERDDVPLAGDPERAFDLERRGAPQAHQTHGFLARLRLTLRDRFPDVHEALIDSGAWTMPLTRDLEDVQEGDDDLAVMILRRTTLEWALRRAALAEPGVDMRGGVGVAGLLGERAAGGVPVVTGVRLESGEEVRASAVVACTGRRGEVAPLLAPLGVEVPEELHETGHVYLTRWYRFDRPDHHVLPARLGGDLGWVKYLAVPGDGDTLSATIAVRTTDTELRSLLADADRFETALRLLPGPRELLSDLPSEPIGGVRPMAGLVNRLRSFTLDGGPTVLGFHAVGDAHTCTNPLYGRGCALAAVQATLLADAFRAHPDDPAARSLAYEAASKREVEPWYHGAVQMDAFRPAAEGGGGEPTTNPIAKVLQRGSTDPVVARGIIRMFNMLTRPDELFSEPAFMARVAEILAEPDDGPIAPEGPSRAELLEAIAA